MPYSKCRNLFCRQALAVTVLLAVFAGTAGAADWFSADKPAGAAAGLSAADLMARLPQDAPIIIVMPPLLQSYAALERFLENDTMAAISEGSGMSAKDILPMILGEMGLEADGDITSLIAKYGLSGDKAVGCALLSPEDETFVAMVPVVDAEAFLKETGIAEESTPAELEIGGKKYQGGRGNMPNEIYAIVGDYLMLGTDEASLDTVIKNLDAPAKCLYGTEEFPASGPDEIVVRFRPENLTDFVEGINGPDAQMVAPVVKLITDTYDEIVVSWNLGGKGLAFRLSGHVRGGAPESALKPMELPAYLPENAALVYGLRFTDALKSFIQNVVQAGTQDSPGAAQAQGMVNFAKGMLGGEAVVALTGFSEESVSGVAIVQSPSPQMIASLLGMLGTDTNPAQTPDAIREIAIPGSPFGNAYYTTTEKALVIGLPKAEVEATLEKVKSGQAGTAPVPAEVLEQGNYGFLYLNSERVGKIVQDVVPDMPEAAFNMGDTTLTLEDHGTYRAATLDNAVWTSAILLPALARARESARRSSSQNNLKQMGLVFKMYANEHPKQVFPAISPKPGVLAPDGAAIFPEYLSDPAVLVHPSENTGYNQGDLADMDPADAITDKYYIYLSHVIQNEEDGLAWVKAYRKAVEAGENLDQDFDVDGRPVYRLREGIEQELLTDADLKNPAAAAMMQSEIPVMWERPGLNMPDGINVLFMDGHVEFLREDNFPYTKAFMDALASLDDLKK